MNGVILKINETGGFGFIGAQNGPDIFFHRTALNGLDFDEQLTGHESSSMKSPGRRASKRFPCARQ